MSRPALPNDPKSLADRALLKSVTALNLKGTVRALGQGANPRVHTATKMGNGYQYSPALFVAFQAVGNLSPIKRTAASIQRTEAILDALVLHGAPVDERGWMQRSVLSMALHIGEPTLVAWALRQAPEQVLQRGLTLKREPAGTVLHDLVILGTQPSMHSVVPILFDQLMAAGAGAVLDVRNQHHKTAWMQALSSASVAMMTALIRTGASTTPSVEDPLWPLERLMEYKGPASGRRRVEALEVLMPTMQAAYDQQPTLRPALVALLGKAQQQVQHRLTLEEPILAAGTAPLDATDRVAWQGFLERLTELEAWMALRSTVKASSDLPRARPRM